MVVIKKRSNVITVPFEGFDLEFRANDENIKNMVKVGKNLEAEAQKIVAETEDEKAYDVLFDMTKAAWCDLFDEAAFEQVYEFSDKTTVDTMVYLFETIQIVTNEWEKRNSGDALKKYLGG